MVVVLPQRWRFALPDHQLLRRDRGLRRDRRLHDLDADPAELVHRSVSRDGCGRRGREGPTGARHCRVSRHWQTLAGPDAGFLARPGDSRRPQFPDLLVSLSEHLGPRRLGANRRRGLLVHRGTERRHSEDRRQARGARGHGELVAWAPGGARGRCATGTPLGGGARRSGGPGAARRGGGAPPRRSTYRAIALSRYGFRVPRFAVIARTSATTSAAMRKK